MVTEGLVALVDLGDTLADCTPALRAALARLRLALWAVPIAA